jgi:predicted PurR-regulated permease PerM
MNENKKKFTDKIDYRITFSTLGILKVLGILAVVFLVFYLRQVFGLLFIALVLASAVDPLIDRLQRYHIPRGVSILVIYALAAVAIFVVVAVLIPPLLLQIAQLGSTLTNYTPGIDHLYQYITQNPDATVVDAVRNNLSALNASITSLTSSFFATISNALSVVASIIFVLVITFYITIEEDGLKKFIRSVAPIQFQPYLVQKTNRIQDRLGVWLSGQLGLMVIIGVLTFIGLSLIGVPYPLVLALLAGLFEFIPFIGPFIAAVPAVFFAFTDSPWKALAVVVFYLILQQLENQVLVPKIMQRALGLSPIVILTAVLIGARIAGLPGILLAVPAVTILWIFVEDVVRQKMEADNSLED